MKTGRIPSHSDSIVKSVKLSILTVMKILVMNIQYMLVRQIATKLSVKRGERYSDTVGFVRRRIRFDLLRTCVIALRGHKKTAAPDSIRDLDFNLRPVAY